MRHDCDVLKVAAMNVGSWFATISSMRAAIDIMQLLGLCASLSLSLFSIWWIRKQAKALDKRQEFFPGVRKP